MEINAALTLTSFEIHFLEEAVEELEKCRRTLMWTYPMAYYLADGNEKEMFEDNQQYVLHHRPRLTVHLVFTCLDLESWREQLKSYQSSSKARLGMRISRY